MTTDEATGSGGAERPENTGENNNALPAAKTARKPYSKRKKLLFTVVAFVFFVFALEIGARVVSYVAYGFNTYYLFYGSKAWKTDDGHSDKFEEYFKFPANSEISHGTPEKAKINRHGFRGEDFEAKKPDGVFRIACLGASSTYGYKNRDAFTYPAILQRLLRNRVPDRKIEVLNCGIPHMNTGHILAMFEQEVKGYDPDLITLYTAFNDATWPLDETTMQRVQRFLDEYSAAYAGLRKIVDKLGGSLHHRFAEYLPQVSAETAQTQVDLHREMYRANISKILEYAKSKGIPVITVMQPIQFLRELEEGEAVPTYEQSYQIIAADLKSKGELPGKDMPLYVHHSLIETLEELAKEYDCRVVDNISLVDAHPDSLVTVVHLSEDANGRLAETLSKTIAPIVEKSAE